MVPVKSWKNSSKNKSLLNWQIWSLCSCKLVSHLQAIGENNVHVSLLNCCFMKCGNHVRFLLNYKYFAHVTSQISLLNMMTQLLISYFPCVLKKWQKRLWIGTSTLNITINYIVILSVHLADTYSAPMLTNAF